MALLVEACRRTLSGDGDDRSAVHVGVGHARDEVGRARAERRHAHAGTARQAPVHVGHEGRPLLVMGRHELDRAVEQRVHDIDVLFAGNAEDVLDTFVLQALDEKLSCSHAVPVLPA